MTSHPSRTDSTLSGAARLRGLTALLGLLAAACSGGGDAGGAAGEFTLDSLSVEPGQTWQINRPITFALSKPLDFSTVSLNTVQIGRLGGGPAVGDFLWDPGHPSILVFQPACPTEPDFSDAGLQPGGVQYVIDVPSQENGSTVLHSADGEPLGLGRTFSFFTPVSQLPTQLFLDPVPGPPGPIPGQVDENGVVTGTRLHFLDDSGRPDLPFLVDETGFGTLGDFLVPLNLYSDIETKFEILVEVDQPVQPSAGNISASRIQLQFLDVLDRYAMVMRSSLLDEARHFKRRKEGRLRMPVAIRKPCEDARAGVQALLREILDPVAPPVQKDMAREYKRRRGYSGGTYHLQFQLEQMMALLAPIEGEAELSPKEPSEAERLLPHLSDIETDAASLLRSRTSPWAFDRMVYYLAQTRCSSKTGRGPEWRKAGVFADRRKAIRAIDQECEYVRASLHDPKTRDLHPFQLDLHPLQFALLALSSFEGEQRFEPEPAHDPDSPESATGTQQQVERLVLLLQEHLKKLDASERQIVELELERLIACAKRLREVHQDGE